MTLWLSDEADATANAGTVMKATAAARKVNTVGENSLWVGCSKLFHRAHALISRTLEALLQPFLGRRSRREIQLNIPRNTQHGRHVQVRDGEFFPKQAVGFLQMVVEHFQLRFQPLERSDSHLLVTLIGRQHRPMIDKVEHRRFHFDHGPKAPLVTSAMTLDG